MKNGRKALILSLSIAASALLAPVIASAQNRNLGGAAGAARGNRAGAAAGLRVGSGLLGVAWRGARVGGRSLDRRASGLPLGP